MIPSSLNIFGLQVHLYGLIIGVGIGVGTYVCVVALRKLEGWGERVSVSEERVWQGMWWALVGGVIGARVYHVVDRWDVYRDQLVDVVKVWNGGLGIYGAIAGGVLGLWLFAKRYRLKLMEGLDLVALGLPLGQAIGRWGNFVNQELYGRPTDVAWGIVIEPKFRLVGYELVERYHPLFLYESLGMLVVFGVLWLLFIKRKFKVGAGMLAAGYLVGYGLVRLLLDPLRLETWRIGGVATAQLLSVVAIMVGLGWIVVKLRKQHGK